MQRLFLFLGVLLCSAAPSRGDGDLPLDGGKDGWSSAWRVQVDGVMGLVHIGDGLAQALARALREHGGRYAGGVHIFGLHVQPPDASGSSGFRARDNRDVDVFAVGEYITPLLASGSTKAGFHLHRELSLAPSRVAKVVRAKG